MRKLITSDMHGYSNTFNALLDQMQFTTQDELYLMGDYIDKGSDSKGVIDTIWDLQEKGYTIHCLRGNHEQILLDELASDTEWLEGPPELLKSFGVAQSREIPASYIDWINQLAYYFEVDNYILVHAGLNFQLDDPLADKNDLLWIRGWYETINKDWLNGRLIVHGHTPTAREDIEKAHQNIQETGVMVMDNGCFATLPGMGSLCGFDMTNNQLYFQSAVD